MKVNITRSAVFDPRADEHGEVNWFVILCSFSKATKIYSRNIYKSRLYIIVHICICICMCVYIYMHEYRSWWYGSRAYFYHFSLPFFFVSLRWNSLNGTIFPLHYVFSSTVPHFWTAVMSSGENTLHNRLSHRKITALYSAASSYMTLLLSYISRQTLRKDAREVKNEI